MERAAEIIRDAKTIAVVGVSSNPDKASNGVAKYLIDQGFTVYLVNPTETDKQIFERQVYGNVRDLPEPVDIVDIFRRPEQVDPVIDDAIAANAKTVWMQLGIVNEDAAAKAREAGIEVVMDACTKIEHSRR
ncbi:MAG: CoA-binding protein [Dehalococcoidia bacterium]